MNLIVFLSALFALGCLVDARSVLKEDRVEEKEQTWITIEDEQGHLHYLNLRQDIPRLDVDDSEVSFHFRSRKTELVKIDAIEDVYDVDFNPKRRTMFIIHGWNNHKGSKLNDLIATALLEMDDWNVFIVDWSGPANSLYTTAKGSINGVGQLISTFIRSLMTKTGIELENVTLVGHSLGAHVAGHASKLLDGEVATIIGLDPAMPFFSYNDIDGRLDPSDAKHVHVIHTNGGFLGFLKPLGHADFYPNGGMNQKGCGIDLLGTCAHARSYIYFAESIISDQFVALSCPDADSWKNGDCDGNEKVTMGGNFIDKRAQGTYYLDTSTKQPFALEINK